MSQVTESSLARVLAASAAWGTRNMFIHAHIKGITEYTRVVKADEDVTTISVANLPK